MRRGLGTRLSGAAMTAYMQTLPEQCTLMQSQSCWQLALTPPLRGVLQQVPVSTPQAPDWHSQSSPHVWPARVPCSTGQVVEHTPSTQLL